MKALLLLTLVVALIGCVEDDPNKISFLFKIKNTTEKDVSYCLSLNDKSVCDTLLSRDSVMFEKNLDSLQSGNPCSYSSVLNEYRFLNDSVNVEVEAKVLSSRNYDYGCLVDLIQVEFKEN